MFPIVTGNETWLLLWCTNKISKSYVDQAQTTTDVIRSSSITLLEHPAYSPDLAPCDFGLFLYMKKQMKGRKFSANTELLRAWGKVYASAPDEKWTVVWWLVCAYGQIHSEWRKLLKKVKKTYRVTYVLFKYSYSPFFKS